MSYKKPFRYHFNIIKEVNMFSFEKLEVWQNTMAMSVEMFGYIDAETIQKFRIKIEKARIAISAFRNHHTSHR